MKPFQPWRRIKLHDTYGLHVSPYVPCRYGETSLNSAIMLFSTTWDGTLASNKTTTAAAMPPEVIDLSYVTFFSRALVLPKLGLVVVMFSHLNKVYCWL